ncbi:unnamed protein product, partial [Mesorhabditis spiculigera]
MKSLLLVVLFMCLASADEAAGSVCENDATCQETLGSAYYCLNSASKSPKTCEKLKKTECLTDDVCNPPRGIFAALPNPFCHFDDYCRGGWYEGKHYHCKAVEGTEQKICKKLPVLQCVDESDCWMYKQPACIGYHEGRPGYCLETDPNA